MSLGCSATNCASSCRRSCAGAEERSAWSSVGSCRLDCTNAQSSQTGRLLRGSNSDWDGQRPKGIYGRRSLNHKNPPFSIGATNLTTGDYRGSGLVQRNVMEYSAGDRADHSALMPADLITLAHFSVSSAMSLPKSAGVPGRTVPPRAASRALILGSARPALISLLSLLITSAGVSFGAPIPNQLLASYPGKNSP